MWFDILFTDEMTTVVLDHDLQVERHAIAV